MKRNVMIYGLFCLILLFAPLSFAQQFTPITEGIIVNDGGNSYGSSWIDYDGDNDLDVFVTNSTNQNNALYQNNNGTFMKVMDTIIGNDRGNSYGCSWGDFDNDGDADLFVANTNQQHNFLYTNNGDGTFTKITSGNIVNDRGVSYAASWADYNRDGYLDLFVSNHNQNNFLYHNNGNGTFTRITEGNIVNDGGYSQGCAWGDYDNDGDLDLFVANFHGQNNFLYQNNGNGTFTKITQGEIVTDGGDSYGGGWGDYDNDGDLDLFVTNYDQNNNLYQNNGNGTFTKITQGDMVNDNGYSINGSWIDYDNDGDLDLYVTNAANENNFLYANDGDGTFTKIIAGEIVEDGSNTSGASWGDYDNDGDLDLFMTTVGEDNLLYNNNGNANHWLNIICVGDSSNRSAIGTKVHIRAIINDQPVWQMREISAQSGAFGQNSLNVEFGFGETMVADSILIEWASGLSQLMIYQPVDQFLTIDEGELLAVPDISVTPTHFDVSIPQYENTTADLFIDNDGEGALGFAVQTSVDWLIANPAQGITLSGERDTVQVVFQADTLAIGTYTTEIIVTSNDPDTPTITIPVELTITPPPEPDICNITPAVIEYILERDEDTGTIPLSIGNCGELDLIYSITISDTITWLQTDPNSGVIQPDANAIIDVMFDGTGLGGDTTEIYTTHLLIVSNDPDQPEIDVPVILTIVGNEAVVVINPPSQNVQPQTEFTTTVDISNVSDLGSFEVNIDFDPAIILVMGVELGDFLGSTGRTPVTLINNIDNVGGILSYAATSFGDQPGPDGEGTLMTINWLSLSNEATSDLTLFDVELIHPDSTHIPHILQDATVTVTACFTYDFDCDGDVDISDITRVAYGYGCQAGDDCYDPRYDFDRDGDIDIADLTTAAYWYGWPFEERELRILKEVIPKFEKARGVIR